MLVSSFFFCKLRGIGYIINCHFFLLKIAFTKRWQLCAKNILSSLPLLLLLDEAAREKGKKEEREMIYFDKFLFQPIKELQKSAVEFYFFSPSLSVSAWRKNFPRTFFSCLDEKAFFLSNWGHWTFLLFCQSSSSRQQNKSPEVRIDLATKKKVFIAFCHIKKKSGLNFFPTSLSGKKCCFPCSRKTEEKKAPASYEWSSTIDSTSSTNHRSNFKYQP